MTSALGATWQLPDPPKHLRPPGQKDRKVAVEALQLLHKLRALSLANLCLLEQLKLGMQLRLPRLARAGGMSVRGWNIHGALTS
eukprot:745674-Hanusia_phi.AAC.2